ncbi:MAG: malonyl-[acyl-carrier protein] O-methyltransferase BioC [Gammaproteobacteria bacterium]|nr:MAG: malonyl-[acyl-carrier protein] O-methyltransferase BioC [Gammaproteobacteria bacterium]RTZ60519.1 MAG: malonyl-[acyl-carrier protein] O-methyltransferase BioC [Gammaproteobacteria bacterium]
MPSSPPTDKQTIATLDRTAVRHSFERAAATYDSAAVLQRKVADELLARLDLMTLEPQRILDLGCGTGYCARALQKRYGKARVFGLDLAHGMACVAKKRAGWLSHQHFACGDAETLPFASDSFDLVVSSLALQWCQPDPAFTEMARVLKPGGVLLFASFGPDTLMELRQAWKAVDDGTHVHDFIDMHDLGDAMLRAGLTDPVVDMDKLVLVYPDVAGLLRDLKDIGASNAAETRPRTLTGRERFSRLLAAYEMFRNEQGRLPATYEVVYGHALLASAAGLDAQPLDADKQFVDFSP